MLETFTFSYNPTEDMPTQEAEAGGLLIDG